jgi:hypothetical protein
MDDFKENSYLPHFQPYLSYFFPNIQLLSLQLSPSFPNNYHITFPYPPTWIWKDTLNMCLFMSTILILIQIKFDIDINNHELLKTVYMGA